MRAALRYKLRCASTPSVVAIYEQRYQQVNCDGSLRIMAAELVRTVRSRRKYWTLFTGIKAARIVRYRDWSHPSHTSRANVRPLVRQWTCS